MLLDAEVFIHRHPFSAVRQEAMSGGERMLKARRKFVAKAGCSRGCVQPAFFLSPIPKSPRNR
jgi:hypothetical protein